MNIACTKVQERDIVIGINPGHEETPPYVDFAPITSIPCPLEAEINQITIENNFDPKDFRVTTVLNIVRKLKRDHPSSPFTGALTDNHVGNIRAGRWHVYPQLKQEDK